ncbi:MAG: alanine dehydrogenase [Candidatus Abyssobacteria bacterium SURF_5]|uniref:Alanine dehydrogenase n=1 Tax=Abyssobacteria bacterium (strain SURF_5) TaxID=2093360 RepID=A0A3A4NIS2_ABYX5|nr:MAG: alanine dehydrogenase [Candidatus Abyssubacteria bacterium SURF_5]
MIIGVPKEIKTDENRVAITPSGVSAFVGNGHQVLIERDAGLGSAIADQAYMKAGARMCDDAKDVWERADMIIKVKEPLGPEFSLMREGQILFTYLHLAADRALTENLMEKKVVAIAYETIQLDDGSLPLLTPMSEVAGRLSIQMGAYCLEAKNGGSGILLPGVSGVPPAKVVVAGAGIAGTNACFVAVGIGARVSILDINPARLRYIHDVTQGHVSTLMSNPANLEEEVVNADLVIGAVLIPGWRAPKLITREMLKHMRKGSALVDIAIDQGGCCESSHPTTHRNPTYIEEGVVHYCVANMPGAVPRTSTYALTNATLLYGLEIANKGWERAVDENHVLKKGVNVAYGQVTHCGVAEAFGLACTSV